MKSSGKHPLDKKVEVDELLIGGPEKKKRGRNKGDKVNANKISQGYAEVIEPVSSDCFKPFFEMHMYLQMGGKATGHWRPNLILNRNPQMVVKIFRASIM